ncbi:acyl-CoA dehydrogenase family protein [Amycolatopsis pithecellobii]|uniref:Pilus assembly protein CpaC n=1 Tax=Amycolatopsis pithecellobii TaxID=664692 RepID=A0A6N7Z5S0_9PSEU|nr:acyl-CoA dehydrogenase family protein [Amycolatopsis pithecellobii]MTD57059.1 pilus assembly protein CpaC [Amycolatopsis pithecellobii]
MDFEIPAEYRSLVEVVHDFRRRELDPLEGEFLVRGHLTPAMRERLDEAARKAGLWALEVPVEYGGQGVGLLGICLVAEEMFKHPSMYLFGGNPEPVLFEGTDEQKERYLLPVIAGERRQCYAFTEADTGSDLARMRTRAMRDGDDWIINGAKIFISRADEADFVILYADAQDSDGSTGTTCFLVDKGTEGFQVSRAIPTMGDAWEPYELVFTGCRVPDSARIGAVGAGWSLGGDQLTHGRIKIASYQLGIARRCIDLAVDWAKRRTTWGKPIATRQAIQWMLADSQVELEAARWLVYKAAWTADLGKNAAQEAFQAKLYATEMAQRVTDRCLQIFGGLGYTKELPVQSFYRQVRLWRIGHGTSEIMRWMIARNLLGSAARD